MVLTSWRADRSIDAASASTCTSAAAIASGSPGGTTMPLRPSSTVKGAPPPRVTTEGLPNSQASSGALGTPSVKLGSSSTFALASAVRGSATAPVILCRPGSRCSARSATLARKPPDADHEERRRRHRRHRLHRRRWVLLGTERQGAPRPRRPPVSRTAIGFGLALPRSPKPRSSRCPCGSRRPAPRTTRRTKFVGGLRAHHHDGSRPPEQHVDLRPTAAQRAQHAGSQMPR